MSTENMSTESTELQHALREIYDLRKNLPEEYPRFLQTLETIYIEALQSNLLETGDYTYPPGSLVCVPGSQYCLMHELEPLESFKHRGIALDFHSRWPPWNLYRDSAGSVFTMFGNRKEIRVEADEKMIVLRSFVSSEINYVKKRNRNEWVQEATTVWNFQFLREGRIGWSAFSYPSNLPEVIAQGDPSLKSYAPEINHRKH